MQVSKFKIFIFLLVSLIGLSSCNNSDKPENGDKSSVNELETVSVEFYYFETSFWEVEDISCKTEDISTANLSDDTIQFMKLYNGIQIDGVWYEDDRICVDLNESELSKLNAGSTAGTMSTAILLKTFASYPNVKEIEVLIGGEKGCIGDHFMFDKIFDAVELD